MHLTLLYIEVKLFLKKFGPESNLKKLILSFCLKDISLLYQLSTMLVNKNSDWLRICVGSLSPTNQSGVTTESISMATKTKVRFFIFFCDIYLFQY